MLQRLINKLSTSRFLPFIVAFLALASGTSLYVGSAYADTTYVQALSGGTSISQTAFGPSGTFVYTGPTGTTTAAQFFYGHTGTDAQAQFYITDNAYVSCTFALTGSASFASTPNATSSPLFIDGTGSSVVLYNALELFGGSSCYLVNGVTYDWGFYNGGGTVYTSGASSSVPYFQLSDNGNFTYSTTNTRFITFTPAGSPTSVGASSTVVSITGTSTVGVTGYINSNDYQSGETISLFPSNQTQNVSGKGYGGDIFTDPTDSASGEIIFPVTSSGYFSFSTSTGFQLAGVTRITYQLNKPNFLTGIPFLGTLFASPTLTGNSYFVVGTSTPFDIAIANTQNAINQINSTGTTTTPQLQCNNIFTGGDITTCLISVVVPFSDNLTGDFDTLSNGILSKAPIAYGVLAYHDITAYNTTATSSLSLSDVTVKLPCGGVFASSTLNCQSFSVLPFSSLLTSSSTANLSNILNPYTPVLDSLFSMAFLYFIWRFFVNHKL